eukprot:g57444.t1
MAMQSMHIRSHESLIADPDLKLQSAAAMTLVLLSLYQVISFCPELFFKIQGLSTGLLEAQKISRQHDFHHAAMQKVMQRVQEKLGKVLAKSQAAKSQAAKSQAEAEPDECEVDSKDHDDDQPVTRNLPVAPVSQKLQALRNLDQLSISQSSPDEFQGCLPSPKAPNFCRPLTDLPPRRFPIASPSKILPPLDLECITPT